MRESLLSMVWDKAAKRAAEAIDICRYPEHFTSWAYIGWTVTERKSKEARQLFSTKHESPAHMQQARYESAGDTKGGHTLRFDTEETQLLEV